MNQPSDDPRIQASFTRRLNELHGKQFGAVKGGVKLDHRSGGKVDRFLVKQAFLREGFAGAAGAEACDPLAGRA